MIVALVMREFGVPMSYDIYYIYDIFKLHHPFSMLVAGPRGAGKSDFGK